MNFRSALPSDATRISALIMSFRTQLTLEPDGRGAEPFFASVSEDSVRGYIESERYEFLLADDVSDLAGFIAIRDKTHIFLLFVAYKFQRAGLARELWNRVRQPIVCYTVNASLNAVPVYERLGFVAVASNNKSTELHFCPCNWSSRTMAPNSSGVITLSEHVMNLRRFVIAVFAIFIFALVWHGFVHMVILKQAGLALEKVARPAAERNMALGLLLTAGVATLFVYSYVSFVRTPMIATGDCCCDSERVPLGLWECQPGVVLFETGFFYILVRRSAKTIMSESARFYA